MGCDPVQKPTIVTADDGAAGETFQSFFERAQGVDIEIVGRLVEDDEVRPLFQHTGQVHPVAFAAGDVLHLLLLIGAREVEPGAVGPGVDFGLAEHNGLVALGDDLVDGFVRIQAAILVHVAQLDRLTNLDRSRIRFLYPDDHPEHRRLTGSVRTDHADNAAFGKTEVHILIEDLVPISFADALGFDDHIAQSWARRDVDLQICGLLVLFLIDQFLIAVEPRLALRLTGFRRHADPFQLMLQRLAALRFGFFFFLQPQLLLFQPGRVIPLEWNAMTAIEFENPAGHVVEEVAVVRDGDDRAFVLLQMLFEPLD